MEEVFLENAFKAIGIPSDFDLYFNVAAGKMEVIPGRFVDPRLQHGPPPADWEVEFAAEFAKWLLRAGYVLASPVASKVGAAVVGATGEYLCGRIDKFRDKVLKELPKFREEYTAKYNATKEAQEALWNRHVAKLEEEKRRQLDEWKEQKAGLERDDQPLDGVSSERQAELDDEYTRLVSVWTQRPAELDDNLKRMADAWNERQTMPEREKHRFDDLWQKLQAETEPATKKQRLDNALKQRLDDLWISLQQQTAARASQNVQHASNEAKEHQPLSGQSVVAPDVQMEPQLETDVRNERHVETDVQNESHPQVGPSSIPTLESRNVLHTNSEKDDDLQETPQAIDDLRKTGIFPDDHGFMEKVGWVESKWGKDRNMRVPSKAKGGVMQVDQIAVDHVKANLPKKMKLRLLKEYGVDVDKIDRESGDLTNVRNCVAVGRAYIFLASKSPIPPTDKEQAAYWKIRYNTKAGEGTEDGFLKHIQSMPKPKNVASHDGEKPKERQVEPDANKEPQIGAQTFHFEPFRKPLSIPGTQEIIDGIRHGTDPLGSPYDGHSAEKFLADLKRKTMQKEEPSSEDESKAIDVRDSKQDAETDGDTQPQTDLSDGTQPQNEPDTDVKEDDETINDTKKEQDESDAPKEPLVESDDQKESQGEPDVQNDPKWDAFLQRFPLRTPQEVVDEMRQQPSSGPAGFLKRVQNECDAFGRKLQDRMNQHKSVCSSGTKKEAKTGGETPEKEAESSSGDQQEAPPNSDDQQEALPNSDDRQAAEPNSGDQKVAESNSDDQQEALPNSDDPELAESNSDDQNVAESNSDDQKMALPNGDDQKEALPNSVDEQDTLPNSDDQKETLPSSNDQQEAQPNNGDQQEHQQTCDNQQDAKSGGDTQQSAETAANAQQPAETGGDTQQTAGGETQQESGEAGGGTQQPAESGGDAQQSAESGGESQQESGQAGGETQKESGGED